MSLITTGAAALAGTVVGNGVRNMIRAKVEGFTGDIVVNGSISSAVAATVLAQTSESRQPLVAFALGAILGGAVGDVGDRWVADLVRSVSHGDEDAG